MNRFLELSHPLRNIIFPEFESFASPEEPFGKYSDISLFDIEDQEEGVEGYYKISIEIRGKKMKAKNIDNDKKILESLESARVLERIKFESLLDEYIAVQLGHGKDLIDILIYLYQKGIISTGTIKKKANINQYELLYKLAEKGVELMPQLTKDEEDDIEELRGFFKC